MTLFETLKDRCRPEWESYTRHEFVQQLGAGTLPLPVFQDYLVQDYHFLVQFARANALAAFKSRTLADLRAARNAGVLAVGVLTGEVGRAALQAERPDYLIASFADLPAILQG